MLAHHPRALACFGAALLALSTEDARADQLRSLDEATFVAELHARSPRRRASALRVRAATAAVAPAAVRPNPSLGWEREAVPGLDTHEDIVRLTWPVDLSGRRTLAAAAARHEAEAVGADAARADLALEIEARRVYAVAASARQQVAAIEAAHARLAGLVEVIQRRAAAGDAAGYDAERVVLELDLLADDLATARRELATARLRLGGLLGQPDVAIDATDDLPEPRAVAAAAGDRDDVRASRHHARAARTDARQARRAWRPRLELGAGVVIAGTAGDDGVGYVVSVGGELPVFDRGAAAARRADALAAMWDADAEALAAEASADVARDRATLVAATAQARSFAEGPARRAAALTRRAEVAYREGDRGIVELLDALRAERTTSARALELRRDARLVELDLWLAIGRTP